MVWATLLDDTYPARRTEQWAGPLSALLGNEDPRVKQMWPVPKTRAKAGHRLLGPEILALGKLGISTCHNLQPLSVIPAEK